MACSWAHEQGRQWSVRWGRGGVADDQCLWLTHYPTCLLAPGPPGDRVAGGCAMLMSGVNRKIPKWGRKILSALNRKFVFNFDQYSFYSILRKNIDPWSHVNVQGDTKGEKVALNGAREGWGRNEDRSPHRLQLFINIFSIFIKVWWHTDVGMINALTLRTGIINDL